MAGVAGCQKKTDLSSGVRIMRTTLNSLIVKLTLKISEDIQQIAQLAGTGLVVSEVSGRRKCSSSEMFLVLSFAGLQIIQERLVHCRPAVSHGSMAAQSCSALIHHNLHTPLH